MKPVMGIFIHDPQCETECALGMIDGLVRDFDIRTFGLSDLNYQFLLDFDIIAFPGGMGDADDFHNIFNSKHIKAVRDYVHNAEGKYLGICMGAYWAGAKYFDIVFDLEIDQYIERPTADINTEFATVANVTWAGRKEIMYFYDGCYILGEDMDVIATYANGDAMAAMQGNVGVIGCHPEALEWWYVEGEMDPEYYDPYHARLMSNFALRLLGK